MTLEDGKMIRSLHSDATLYRPIHEAVIKINERFPDTSIRFTADTITALDKLPIQLERHTGVHDLGSWRIISFESKTSLDEHLILLKGDLSLPDPLLVRVHSSFIMNEIFHIAVSDDRDQLHTAMQEISEAGRGIVIYINQEGSGNRLSSAVAQLALTNMGIPMIQAFETLGVPVENRSFVLATDTLKMLEISCPIALMTNNLKKRRQLEEAGFRISPYEFTVKPTNETTAKYLEAKRDAGIY